MRRILGNSDSGVSPVIGVLLMIGLVVAVGALATTVVFDVSDVSTSSNADVTLDIETAENGSNAGNFDVTATVIRNGNVQELRLENSTDNVQFSTPIEAGSSETFNNVSESSVQVIAVPEGQTEGQVIQVVDL